MNVLNEYICSDHRLISFSLHLTIQRNLDSLKVKPFHRQPSWEKVKISDIKLYIDVNLTFHYKIYRCHVVVQYVIVKMIAIKI